VSQALGEVLCFLVEPGEECADRLLVGSGHAG
jgi:hypothetical protein